MRALLLILALLAAPARAGWTAGAWPACEHVGGREFSPGVLYKQIWARDIYYALEERSLALFASGSTNVWTLGGSGTRPTWWTVEGVTNQVVRYDRGQVSSAADQNTRFLPAAKYLAGKLASYYLDTATVDPDDMPASWHAWQLANGARTNVVTFSETFTGWSWECPRVAHTRAFELYEPEQLATPPYRNHSATGLAVAVSLPRDYLGITPFRLLEGFCDPDTAALAPSFVYSPTGQGTSPHDSGDWYWTDFGWDGLRAIITGLKYRLVPGSGASERYPFADIGWYWDQEGANIADADDWGYSAQITFYPDEGDPEELQAGSFLEAVAAEEALRTTSTNTLETVPPHYAYGNVIDFAESSVSGGENRTCEWLVQWSASRATAALELDRAWPPAGVSAAVTFFADYKQADAPGDQGEWGTDSAGALTFATPSSTGWHAATNVIGTITHDALLFPGDPTSTEGLPMEMSIGNDYLSITGDTDITPGLARGNLLYTAKTWAEPIALIEFTWSYP